MSTNVFLTLKYFICCLYDISLVHYNDIFREVLNSARPLMKLMAISVLVESMQSYGSGVLKTVGAQQYAMVFNLICFYILGIPIGYYFMFESGLKALGMYFYIKSM